MELSCSTFQPCLSACIDQQYKVLVSQATYPNEDTFIYTSNFCYLLNKLSRSCSIEKRTSLDLKYPGLCDLIEAEVDQIQDMDCNLLDGRTDAQNFTVKSNLIISRSPQEHLCTLVIILEDKH